MLFKDKLQYDPISRPHTRGYSSVEKSAFRIFSGCPNLVMDLQTDAVLNVLGRGLQDQYSIEVQL